MGRQDTKAVYETALTGAL